PSCRAECCSNRARPFLPGRPLLAREMVADAISSAPTRLSYQSSHRQPTTSGLRQAGVRADCDGQDVAAARQAHPVGGCAAKSEGSKWLSPCIDAGTLLSCGAARPCAMSRIE